VTSLGEQLASAEMFSERNFGGLVQVSYPFNRFRRLDMQFTHFWVERQFFVEYLPGYIGAAGKTYRTVTSPSVSLINDNTLSSYYGPVNGARSNLTFSLALPVTYKSLDYRTVTFERRNYWDLTSGYTFVTRGYAAGSWGQNPQAFRLGGFSTLRGVNEFDLVGTRVLMANTELRFPFIEQLGLVGPLPIGNFNLRGAMFADMGMVWNHGDPLKLTTVGPNGRELASPLASFGVRVRSFIIYALMKVDVAWLTNGRQTSQPHWYFSLGPEF
jgi:outer membrane protein assembly factor BamA